MHVRTNTRLKKKACSAHARLLFCLCTRTPSLARNGKNLFRGKALCLYCSGKWGQREFFTQHPNTVQISTCVNVPPPLKYLKVCGGTAGASAWNEFYKSSNGNSPYSSSKECTNMLGVLVQTVTVLPAWTTVSPLPFTLVSLVVLIPGIASMMIDCGPRKNSFQIKMINIHLR